MATIAIWSAVGQWNSFQDTLIYITDQKLYSLQYLLDIQSEFLTEDQSLDLQDYLTVNGHSMANPILDADGNVDKEASRRVEVKFRLKDDEMIDELSKIMSGTDESTSADTTTDTSTDNSADSSTDTAQ